MVIWRLRERLGHQSKLPETPASAREHQGFRTAVTVVAGFYLLLWPPDPCLTKQLANPEAER